ncbi:MAG: hypothetical protein QF404_10945, partial [Planctomycetota bacterium]|nr:hypothetical protein [Planctomycetota bacterium]
MNHLNCLVILSLMSICIGCGGGGGGGGGGEPSYDTPTFYLSQPGVQAAIDATEQAGYPLRIFQNTVQFPPSVEGKYDYTGTTVLPFEGPLNPGTFEWTNQTQSGDITTSFSQYLDLGYSTGVSTFGEIVRGDFNEFTVYSHIRVDTQLTGS